MNRIEVIVHSIDQLPPLPAIIHQALQRINDPKASAQDVVEIIQYDQGITSQVLKVCNSAYFNLRRQVHSLREALVLLGFNTLMQIMLNKSFHGVLSRSCQGYDLDTGALWKHSVSCAILTEIIARRLQQEPDSRLFTAGLLHDMGKVVLSANVRETFAAIKNLVREQGYSFVAAEREVLGIDHAELGALIAEKWKFPPAIIAAVRYHHTPWLSGGDYSELVGLTHLANCMALLTGIGGGSDGLYYAGDPEIMEQYRLREKDVEKCLVQLNDRLQAVEAWLEVA
ncbi:MAG: HDOD domain-containing protein [Deltaproteobacteria bacterium]|nr:HDOD domain-containing protein [Deltaproteobacteria bacterium]